MRIVYVNDALAIWGGLERILVEKVNYLAEHYDYDVYLLTANQGSHPIPYPLSGKVHYHDLDIRFHQQYRYRFILRVLKRWQLNRLFVQKLRKCLWSISPDVVVSVRSELTSGIVSAKGSIPLVYESHTSRFAQRFIKADWYTKLKADWYNRSVKNAQVVVTLTEGDAADWKEVNPSVCIIPNIVHLNDKGIYSSCDQKTVIYVGRFSRQKDIRSLLQVWSLVHPRYPDWKLQIYGGYGEEQDLLLPLIAQMRANIEVCEPTPHIFDHYLNSSIFLLTSLFEPFGLVLPEAMSCGLPVVAFDCPYGPADIITDGVDGYVIKNRDVQKYADKVCMLMESLELRQKMGEAGVSSARRYEAEHIMPKWKQLFESILAKEK